MKRTIYLFAMLLFAASCKKSIEVDLPKGSLTDSAAFQKNGTATAVLTGAIQTAMINFSGGSGGLSNLGGLSADELNYVSVHEETIGIYQNSIATRSALSANVWAGAYNVIYICNSALEGIEASSSPDLTEPVRNQLIGEAKYMRAFMYFYLINVYGDVPLLLESDYRVNMLKGRTPKPQVYAQILSDLLDAKELLNVAYLGDNNAASNSKNRPNKAVATALLARVYLYQEDWLNAELQATELINNPAYRLETDLSRVFLTVSREAIWQMEEGTSAITTKDGAYFIILVPANGIPSSATLNPAIYNLFTTSDTRRANWIGSVTTSPATGSKVFYYANKYKIRTGSTTTEKTMVLRLAEQYLIRAEAKIRQNGKLAEGIADLNTIRRRAFGLPLTAPAASDYSTNLNTAQAIQALESERRLELFTEWGHRWFDLKRWSGFNNPAISRADEIMPAAAIAKGGVWNTTKQLFPIPQNDRTNNPTLGQNLGYANQ